jgi:predicted nucleic acid-binding protein
VKIEDVQIVFYAIDPASELHDAAARWFEDAVNAREPLGLTWPTIHQFLRLGTNAAFSGCMTDSEAVGWIEELIEAGVEVISDVDLQWDLFAELVPASP